MERIERLYDKMANEKKVNRKDIDIMKDILIENGVDIDTLCNDMDEHEDRKVIEGTIVDTFIRWNIKVEVNKDDWYWNSLWGDYFPAYCWILLLQDWQMCKITIE